MKNSRARGAELAPLEFEVVPLPVLPAHDRAPLLGVQVADLPDYVPVLAGRKRDILFPPAKRK